MSREGWGEGLVILARSVSVRMLSRRHGGGAVRVALHCAGHRKTNVPQFFPGVVFSRS